MVSRVLHLLSQRPGWTGSGVALDAIVRAADRGGWKQAAVVGTSPDDPSPEVGGLDQAVVWPLVFERDSLTFPLPGMSDVMPYRSSRFSQLSSRQLSAYHNAWKQHVSTAIKKFRPDVIHCHHIWLLSSMLKDVSRCPVVTHCHGTGLRQMELCPQLSDEVRAGCARNDAFCVLHGGHAVALEEQLGVAPERIHVIGSGFREDIFHANDRSPAGDPIVIYAGKLSRAKGVPWLLEAIDSLAQSVPGLKLHIAGSGAGDEADAIVRRIASMPNVVFHGQLDQQQLAGLLRRSSVFVLPSFFEGLPLVLVEAAACGCRLVATALPGIVNQLQPRLGETLQLVPLPRLEGTDRPIAEDLPQFVKKLAAAIGQSVANPQIESAATSVNDMTWDAVFQRIESVWRQTSE